MAPFRLLDLPTETIMMVIENLCMHCFDPGPDTCCVPAFSRGFILSVRQSALAKLARTSKHLNTLVTPHLYHEPVGNWSLLLRTLVERPDLAQHVKSVQVGENVPCIEMGDGTSGGGDVAAALAEMIEERAEGVFGEIDYEDDLDEWEEAAKETADAAEFLIAMCPSMSHLDIAIDRFGPRFTMVGYKDLPDLKHATLSYLDTEGGWDMSLLSRLPDVAPNLASLFCRSVVTPIDFSDKFKNVTRLQLYNCSIESGALEPILRAFPRLEIFDFFAGDACVSYEPHLSMREMQDVLTVCTPGLKSLSVCLMNGNHQRRVESPDLWSSLSSLAKLEHLDFDYRCIFPYNDPHTVSIVNGQPVVLPSHVPGRMVFADLLPRSIRTIRFRHGPEVPGRRDVPSYFESVDGLLSPLEYLGSVAAERFPSLRRFELTNAWRLPGDINRIKSAMEGSGIEFVAAVYTGEGYTPSADEKMYNARLAWPTMS